MFDRISNGWELAKESWSVLQSDKELLLFPLFSGIACLIVLASFAVPLYATGFAGAVLGDDVAVEARANEAVANQAVAPERGDSVGRDVIGYVLLFAFYFVNYFVIVFFNSALIACAVIRFKGDDPTLADGFAAAWSRLPQIAGWAFLAATVGVLLKVIESRSERVGQVVAGLLGMAWSIVTYFVVPVIVVERAGPIQATKRSAAVMKSTWGESLFANFGIGLIVFLAMLVASIPLVAGMFAIAADHVMLGVAGILIGVCAVLLLSLISSALNAIIVAALYLYAVEGKVPSQFDDRLLRDAFATK